MPSIDIKQRVIDLTVEQLITVIRDAMPPQEPNTCHNDKNRLLNIREAAELLGYKVSTIYDKTHRRLIPFMKKGRKIWFREADLLAWAASGKKDTKEERNIERKKQERAWTI